MKKLVSITLCFLLVLAVFSLSGCKKETAKKDTKKSSSVSQTVSDEQASEPQLTVNDEGEIIDAATGETVDNQDLKVDDEGNIVNNATGKVVETAKEVKENKENPPKVNTTSSNNSNSSASGSNTSSDKQDTSSKTTSSTNKDTGSKTESTSSTPAHTHNYSAATCTAAQKCSCGATKGSALGHSYNGGVITTAATTTSEGVKTYTCTRCGVTKTESIAKLPAPSNPYGYINAWGTIAQMEADMAAYVQSLGYQYDYSLNLDNSCWGDIGVRSNAWKTSTEMITTEDFKNKVKEYTKFETSDWALYRQDLRVRVIFITKDNLSAAGSYESYVSNSLYSNEIMVIVAVM